MIAKIIAWGEDRDEALARLRRALADTMVVVDGGTTNQGFLLELLDRPEVRTGEVDTTWLDRLHLDGEIVPMRHADVALLQAAIVLAEAATAADRARFYALARRGRPQADADLVRTVELRHRGQTYRLAVGADRARPLPRDRRRRARSRSTVHRVGPHERRLEVGGRAHRTLTSVQDADLRRRGRRRAAPDRARRRRARAQPRARPSWSRSRSPSATRSHAGDVVAVVEAMKMESSLTAPFDGRVRQVLVGANVQVPAQAPLVQIEPLDGGAPPASGDRVAFASPTPSAAEGCLEQLRRLEWLVLGYDVGAGEVERIMADLHGACADPATKDSALAGEHRLLRMFADVRALSRPRHDEADPETPWLRSPQEHLNTWLRSLDAEAEGLPDRLHRAAARSARPLRDRRPRPHAGARGGLLPPATSPRSARATARAAVRGDPRPSPRAGRAARRAPRRRLPRGARPPGGGQRRPRSRRRRPRPRGALPLLRRAGHRRRHATASTPRWRQHVAALAADPARPDRDERIAALVACPRPLAALLTARMRAAEPALQRLLARGDGAPLLPRARARGLRARAHRRPRPAAGAVPVRGPAPPPGGGLRRPRRRRRGGGAPSRATPPRCPPTTWPCSTSTPSTPAAAPTRDELAASLREALAGTPLPAGPAPDRRRRRAARARARDVGHRHVHLPPQPEGLVEDEVLRGLHPMMAHRLAAVAPARTSPSSGCPRPRTSTSSTASRTPTRRTSGCSRSPRCATSPRSATRTGGSSRCPSSSACSSRRSRPSARFQAAARPASACSGTASCSTSGRRSSSPPRRSTSSCSAWRRSASASGSSTCSSAAACASPTARCATACCASSPSSARASSSRSATRRPSRCSRSTRARGGSSPRAGAASCTRPRSSGCSRPRAATAGHPAGDVRRARPRRRRRARPRRPPAGDQRGEHRRRH